MLPIRYSPANELYPGDEVILYLEHFGHEVVRIQTHLQEKRSIIKTLRLRFVRYVKLIVFVLFDKPEIITVTQDIIDSWVVYPVCKLFNIRFVIRRSNPLEQMQQMEGGRLYKLIAYLQLKLGYMILKRADLIHAISEGHKDLMIDNGLTESKIAVTPPGIDLRKHANVA